jgi:hypothetical protein
VARNYAQIMTAIWRNAEFRALAEREQRTYLLLVTQPDISAAGVLALRLRRWADMAADSTPDGLVYALKVLEAGRFIVVDWDAEELLVRSFIRWDGGFGNPKRRPVIIRSASEVDSTVIRRHLASEFQRCGITALPGGPPDSPPPASSQPPDSPADSLSNSLSGSPSKIDNADRASDPFPQVNSLSDRDAPSGGVVVTYLATEDAATHNPQPVPPTAGAAAPPPDPATAQTLVGEWIDSRRKRPPGPVIGQTSKVIKAMLEEGIDPDDIRAGIRTWADKGLHPSALPSVVNEVMNARPQLRAVGGGRPARVPTTTQRVNEALALLRPGED